MTFTNAKIVAAGVSYEQYAAQKFPRGDRRFVMSRGELMSFAECPHKWLAGHDEGDSKATDWGRLMDALVLSPAKLTEMIAVCPATYPDKKAGEPKEWNFNATFCKDWKREQGSKLIVKAGEKASADAAFEAFVANENARSLVLSSRKQVMVTAEWRDDNTGIIVPVKTLIDIVPGKEHERFGKALADFKTAASAGAHKFERAIFRHHYDAQAALYLDTYVAATGEDRTDWVFCVQESSPPYEVADPLPMLSTEFLTIGRAKYRHALAFYARCLSEDKWPSYSPGPRMVINGCYVAEPEPWMALQAVEWPAIAEPESEPETEDVPP